MARITAYHKSLFEVPCPSCRSGAIRPGRLAWMAKVDRGEVATCSEVCAKRYEKIGGRDGR